MDQVAVVILNWNGISHFETFLQSVVEHTSDATLWIVDNGSTDTSLEYAKSRFPQINILKLDSNLGFAKGYNQGLQRIKSDYYVLLNSDVEVTANWIQPVIDYMKKDGIVACQPKILDYNRKTFFEHAGATGGFIDKDGFTFCAGRIFNEFEEDLGQYDQNKEVFWASGAALFIESEKYWEVGGLDPDFFAHMEEIDLCWRLKNRGYKIGACGQSVVYHLGGGTLNAINPYKTFLNFRNNLYLLIKNHFSSPIALKLMKRLLLDGVAAFRFILEGKWSYSWAVLKAHLSFYRHLGLMLRKRKDLQQKLNHPDLTGLYKRSILKDFFIEKKTQFSLLNPDDFGRR